MKKTIIIGGGIAGLSLASFIRHETVVLERNPSFGGLSRSYSLDGINYDIGPHIIFSKNREVLDLHTTIIPTTRIRRSNRVFYKGHFVKYPFENDLYGLPPGDRDYCLNEFLNNPYENYEPGNMLQFFLKTFGEGITRLYLQPYNEKIWKFDPSCMDIQMVERIPKPPREDVIASAAGKETEGYKHQLYFHYPSAGGFQTLVDAYVAKAAENGRVEAGIEINSIRKEGGLWRVSTPHGVIEGDRLVNCAPLHEFFKYLSPPEDVRLALEGLKFNSIHVVMPHVKKDNIGDHLGLYFSDPSLIFHRISKIDFLGENYRHSDGSTTLMAEITFRQGSYLGSLDVSAVARRVIRDLARIKLIDESDVIGMETRTEKYAYVIYDLNHRKNADCVLAWLNSIGIRCAGRFAEFEYLNTDAVVERTLKLADEINNAVCPESISVLESAVI